MKKILVSFLSFCLVLMSSSYKMSTAYAEEVLKTIAILDFENNTGSISQDNLKKALSDSLTINLAKYKSLSIVERTRLKDAVSEVTLNQSTFVSADNAIKIGKTLGAEFVLLGSISKIGEIFEVSERIVEVETSKIINAKSIRCSKQDAILKGIDYLSLEIAKAFGENIEQKDLEIAKKEVEYANNPELLLIKKDEISKTEAKEDKPSDKVIILSKEDFNTLNNNQAQMQTTASPINISDKKNEVVVDTKKENVSNNNWIWITLGGVLVAGGTALVIYLVKKNSTTTVQPKPILPRDTTLRDPIIKRQNNFDQVNIFSFTF